MRKFLIVTILAILVIGVAITPFVTGYYYKQTYLNFLAGLNKESDLKFTVLEYRLGWLHSFAKVSIESKSLSAEAGPFAKMAQIIFEKKISHGPIVHDPLTNKWLVAKALMQSSFYLPTSLDAMIVRSPANQAILQGTTIVKFNDNFINTFGIPALSITIPGGAGKFTWQGLKINSSLQLTGQQITQANSDVTIGAIYVSSLFGTLTTQNILFKHQMNKENNFWVGSNSISMPDLSFVDASQERYSYKNLNISDSLDLKNKDLYQFQSNVSLSQFMIPKYVINDFNFKVAIQDLGAPDVVNLYNYYNSAQQREKLNDKNVAKHIKEFENLFVRILRSTTKLSYSMMMTTSQGKTQLVGNAYITKLVKSFDEFLKNSHSKSTFRTPIEWVNYVIDIQFPKHDPEAPVVAATPLNTKDAILQNITGWIEQNKISMSVGLSLKDLVNRNLEVIAFNENIKEFVTRKDLPEDLANDLIMKYSMLGQESTVSPTMPAPILQPQLSEAEKIKQWINNLVSKGFIKKDGTDYVIEVTYDQGVVKINGLAVDSEMQALMPPF